MHLPRWMTRRDTSADRASATNDVDGDAEIVRHFLRSLPARIGGILLAGGDVYAQAHWGALLARAGAEFTRIAEPDDAWLRRRPPSRGVLDISGGDDVVRQRRWFLFAPHLVPGGAFCSVDTPTRATARVAWAEAVVPHPLRAETSARSRSVIASASETPAVAGRSVTLFTREPHVVLSSEREAEDLLARRNPGLTLTTSTRVPGASYDLRARVVQHESTEPPRNFAETFSSPPMTLRRYDGALEWHGGMVLRHRQTLLPSSVRFPYAARPQAPTLQRADDGLYTLRDSAGEPRAVTGPVYDLTAAWPSHFGHFMSQSVAKLWGWDQAKAESPRLRAVVEVAPGVKPGFELDILTAYGIAPDDILWVGPRVRAHTVYSASLQFHNSDPQFMHPDLTQTWERLTTALTDPAVPTIERLFVSRQRHQPLRSCRNLAAVEALFEKHGFTVYFPEEHSVAHQASTFAGARVIAGLGGSAMFNLVHARAAHTLIVLNHESYVARNEHLISSSRDWDVHYFWSQAAIQHPVNGYSDAAFQSPWSFDFERNGAELERLLRDA